MFMENKNGSLMKTSARNQLPGKITAVKHGPVTSEITLQLANGMSLVGTVTEESCRELGLTEGGLATALIKASNIIVATDLHPMKLSARNQLSGLVTHVERGAVNSIVSIDIAAASSLLPASPCKAPKPSICTPAKALPPFSKPAA